MPCDRVYYTDVNLDVADRDLLAKALTALGYEVYAQRDGRLTVRAGRQLFDIQPDGTARLPAALAARVPQIQQAYAAQVVAAGAQKFGWRVQTKSPQQLTLSRRA